MRVCRGWGQLLQFVGVPLEELVTAGAACRGWRGSTGVRRSREATTGLAASFGVESGPKAESVGLGTLPAFVGESGSWGSRAWGREPAGALGPGCHPGWFPSGAQDGSGVA